MATRRRYSGLGKLYDLLDKKMSETFTNRYGNLDVAALAKELGVSSQAMYRYLQKERLPQRHIRTLTELGEAGGLTINDLEPFLV